MNDPAGELGRELTAQGRADLAQEVRIAASRLDDLTTFETMVEMELCHVQDHGDMRLVWTLRYVADVLEGRRRN